MVLPTGSVNVSVTSATGYHLKSISSVIITAGRATDASMTLTPASSGTAPTISDVLNAINMFLGLNTPAPWVDMDRSNAVSAAEMQKVLNSFSGQ